MRLATSKAAAKCRSRVPAANAACDTISRGLQRTVLWASAQAIEEARREVVKDMDL